MDTLDRDALGEATRRLKEQLLIVLTKKLGGSVELTVEEVDDTGEWIFIMEADAKERIFRCRAQLKNRVSKEKQ